MLHNYRKTGLLALGLLSSLAFAPASSAAIVDYYQNFEGLASASSGADPAALTNDGWKVFADVSFAAFPPAPYTYGPFGAPNGGPGFSAVADGEGGPNQGLQYLNVYSDYNNGDHATPGSSLFTTVFQEQYTTAGAGDTATYYLTFDAKSPFSGGIAEPGSNSTASAFIQVLDPGSGYGQTGVIEIDMTGVANDTWQTFQIALAVDGVAQFQQILQFGFHTTATGYEPSGVFYDNVCFNRTGVCDIGGPAVPVPAAVWLFGSGLLGLIGVARRRKS
jgi:hypothetical protein